MADSVAAANSKAQRQLYQSRQIVLLHVTQSARVTNSLKICCFIGVTQMQAITKAGSLPGRSLELAKQAAQLFHEHTLAVVLPLTLLGMLLLCHCHQLPANRH